MKKVKKGILKNYREVGLQYRNMPIIYFFLNNKAYFHKKKNPDAMDTLFNPKISYIS